MGLKEPAPVLCTYMARRPPQFTLNLCGARHINIAHGLYPWDHSENLELDMADDEARLATLREGLVETLRYSAGPPISEDDLMVISGLGQRSQPAAAAALCARCPRGPLNAGHPSPFA